MWNKRQKWVYLFLIVGVLFSCKTQKTQKTEQEANVSHVNLEYNTFNAPKMTFTLVQGQNTMSVNGSLRISKDSIIILSIQPFLGLEVARVGITKNAVTLIDRINKRYFSSDFAALKEQLGIDINYNAFQSIFTNSLFVYDKESYSFSSFKEVEVGGLTLLQTSSGGINQEFNVDKDYRILSGMLFTNSEPYSIRWNYMQFNALENGYFFPHLLKITAIDGKNQNQLDIAYNKVELNKNINFQFSVPSSYKKVTWDELIQILK